MFRKNRKAVALQTDLVDMLKKRPLEMYRTDRYLAMYAPGIEKVVVVIGRNSHMSEGDCLRSLVLATREQHA
jgi:hypothetical protein